MAKGILLTKGMFCFEKKEFHLEKGVLLRQKEHFFEREFYFQKKKSFGKGSFFEKRNLFWKRVLLSKERMRFGKGNSIDKWNESFIEREFCLKKNHLEKGVF